MPKKNGETVSVENVATGVVIVDYAADSGSKVYNIKGGITHVINREKGYFGVLNRSRRVGEKAKGAEETRPQFRDNVRLSIPQTELGMDLVYLYCNRYLIGVDGADLGLYNANENGAQDTYTNTDELASTYFAELERKLAETSDGGSGVEQEYVGVSADFRGGFIAAGADIVDKKPVWRTDEKSVAYKAKYDEFKPSYIRGVVLGTIEATPERRAAFTAKVEAKRAAQQDGLDV